MKSRTHQQWRELFRQQARGDLSVAEFCKVHRISQSYFYKRKSDLAIKADNHSPEKFIKVKSLSKDIITVTSIKIQHQQTQLDLPSTTSAVWLAEFIKALA